jgi:hypothetical protein
MLKSTNDIRDKTGQLLEAFSNSRDNLTTGTNTLKDLAVKMKEEMVILSQQHMADLAQSLNTCFITFVKKAESENRKWSLAKSVRLFLILHSIQPEKPQHDNEKILGDLIERLTKVTDFSDGEAIRSDHGQELLAIGHLIFDHRTQFPLKMQLMKFILNEHLLNDNRALEEIHKSSKTGDHPIPTQYEKMLDAIQRLLDTHSLSKLDLVLYYYSGKAIESNYSQLKEIYSSLNSSPDGNFGQIFKNQSVAAVEDYLALLVRPKGEQLDVLKKHKSTDAIRMILAADHRDDIPNLYQQINQSYLLFTLLTEKQPKLVASYRSHSHLSDYSARFVPEALDRSPIGDIIHELHNSYISLIIKTESEGIARHQSQSKHQLTTFEKFTAFLANFTSFHFCVLSIVYTLAVDHSNWNEMTEKRNITDKVESLEEYFDFFERNASRSQGLSKLKSDMLILAEKLYLAIPPLTNQNGQEIHPGRNFSKEMFEI